MKNDILASESSLKLGQLIFSKAGRDKGTCYLICGFSAELLLLVDGKKRGLDNPKKKNPRHIQPANKVAADFVKRINNGELIRNEEIHYLISGLLEKPKG